MATKINDKVNKAINYLKSIGSKGIIIFGSIARKTYDNFSDIDIAIKGISPRVYFKALAELSPLIGKKVDLILLDFVSKEFVYRIRNEGKLVYAI
ncbi:MAG: nucleotidyltransferase family protein [Candidatus Helarchaeota archaeon]